MNLQRKLAVAFAVLASFGAACPRSRLGAAMASARRRMTSTSFAGPAPSNWHRGGAHSTPSVSTASRTVRNYLLDHRGPRPFQPAEMRCGVARIFSSRRNAALEQQIAQPNHSHRLVLDLEKGGNEL